MKVIMLSDVKGVGKTGQIITVKDGYGSNFLIPNKLAVRHTDTAIKILADEKKAEADKIEKAKAEANKAKELLEQVTLEFTAKPAADGRMCGTISLKQVENELKTKFKIEIDKRKFVEKFPINAFGITMLKIELFKGVIGVIKVHVSEGK
ncbi:MAG: 50S ribosomal protein L9 [Bacilli bacterium]